MSVYQVNILTEQGDVLLRDIPVHLPNSDTTHGNCILWGNDCWKIAQDGKYKLSLRDKRLIDCAVVKIQKSSVERSAAVEFLLAPML
jgi:hypothetical protein